jgi:hypothetical protein
MKFLFIIGHDDNFGPSPRLIQDIIEWNAKHIKEKILEDSNPLEPWRNAKYIKTVNGKTVIKDGSFSNSKEKISAYALINCESMNKAIEIASSHPMARVAVIEVRPIWENISGNLQQ